MPMKAINQEQRWAMVGKWVEVWEEKKWDRIDRIFAVHEGTCRLYGMVLSAGATLRH